MSMAPQNAIKALLTRITAKRPRRRTRAVTYAPLPHTPAHGITLPTKEVIGQYDPRIQVIREKIISGEYYIHSKRADGAWVVRKRK